MVARKDVGMAIHYRERLGRMVHDRVVLRLGSDLHLIQNYMCCCG